MKPIRVFNHTLHKEMWEWVAKNQQPKSKWPGWKELNVNPRKIFWCLACACAEHLDGVDLDNEGCTRCPLEWGTRCGMEGNACYYEYCEFDNFICASGEEEIRNAAYAIADAPLKDDDRFVTIIL